MTKAELLAELAGLDWVDWVDPAPTPGAETPAGDVKYDVSVKEKSGDIITPNRTITFYVKNDGEQDEEACWKGHYPQSTLHLSVFRQWIYDAYTTTPGNFDGIIIHKLDEIAQTCIFTRLDASGDDLVQQAYFVKMNQSPTKIVDFDVNQLKPDLPIDRT